MYENDFLTDLFGMVNPTLQLTKELDYLIRNDFLEYCKRLNEIKADNYKVFRNSNNKHKVERRD